VASEKKHDSDGGLSVFGAYASEYDANRPHYPAAFFDDCASISKTGSGSSSTPTAADICAGTGRGAVELVERGFETIALDADIKMLEQVGHPSIRIIHTPATETTLPDASQDLVLCLQAFHWLDAEAALAEFSRVLKPSGVAVIAWNDRDLADPFTQDFESLVEANNDKYTRDVKISENYEESMKSHARLQVFDKIVYENDTPTNADAFVRQTKTFSYIKNVLGDGQEMDKFEAETRDIIKSHFGDAEGGAFVQAWKTKAYFLRNNA
jgi:SAM-dependent methyltransferase